MIFDQNIGVESSPQQPMVVVAILLLLGIYVGELIGAMCEACNLERMVWVIFSLTVSAGVWYIWRRGVVAMVLLVLMIGALVAASAHIVNGPIYEGSTVQYIKERRFERSQESPERRRDRYDIREYNMSIGTMAERINCWAAGRVRELGLSEVDEGLVMGIVLGRKWSVDAALRDSYGRGGAAHLLAVSGLHLGVVCLIFNLLLSLLTFVHHGHLARSVILLLIIWAYTAVAGMHLSVMRAALMFTVWQITYITGRTYESLNVISMIVLIMVMSDIKLIYDAGFIFSVTSVISILLWALPIISWLRGWVRRKSEGTKAMKLAASKSIWSKVIWYFVSAFIISLSCVVATMPLSLYLFGYITLWGVLISPLVIATTTAILAITLLWILVGVGLLGPLFTLMLSGVVWLQNWTIMLVSSGWRGVIHIEINELTLISCYTILVLFTFVLYRLLRRGTISDSLIHPEWEDILSRE